MSVYFVVANSNAAPFFSDTSKTFVVSGTAQEALDAFVANYGHPMGLYAAGVWPSADSFEKNEKPLVRFLSAKAQQED